MIPQDKIIEWAREADFYVDGNMRTGWADYDCTDELTLFANLVAEHQKEKDARICDMLVVSHKKDTNGECEEYCEIVASFETCAAAIRSQE